VDVHHVARWRDLAWWHALQIIGASADPLNSQSWRHERTGSHACWERALVQVLGEDWRCAASDRHVWRRLSWDLTFRILQPFEGARPGRFSWAPSSLVDVLLLPQLREFTESAKPLVPRSASDHWCTDDSHAPGALRCSCCADSELLVKWVNGEARIEDRILLPLVQHLQDSLATLQLGGLLVPWNSVSPLVCHVPRENNVYADALANEALDNAAGSSWWHPAIDHFRGTAVAALLHSDGASRGNPGPGSSAAVLSLSDGSSWTVVAHISRLLGNVTNNVAEVDALVLGVELLQGYIGQYVVLDA
jgi:hypothetical protein